HQVKIRGFRIELGEIEAVLDRHPQVRQSVVMAREDEPGNKRLVAYVVAEDAPTAFVDQWRAHLRTTLPEFMVPSAFVMMEAFPLSSNGKVNRRALPAPASGRPEQVYVAPSNETEERIASIWAEVLHVPQVGIHDDFFLLGGHSLRATQVISRLRQAFAMEVPLRAMFETPTVAGLAKRIQTIRDQSDSAPIPRARRDQPLPLSFAQQRLWFLDQLEPNNPLYNIPWALRIRGKLDTNALDRSLNAIVERHESLRTTFHSVEDQPVQVVAPSFQLPLNIVDLSELPDRERRSRVDELIAEESQRAFDLASLPLLRSTLLKIADNEHVLVLNIHHIVSDRWSMGVLSQELAALYAAAVAGKNSPLPEMPVQYADFAVWQRQRVQGDFFEKQL